MIVSLLSTRETFAGKTNVNFFSGKKIAIAFELTNKPR
jgi:hypothetical protein